MESSTDTETEPLCLSQNLFLKPLAKIEIIIRLPKITVPGQSISNWDLMERLKKAVNPIQLEAIRVRESSLESVIFEAELLSKSVLKQAMKSLDSIAMKVSGFSEPLRVKASETKSEFPCRHDWDLFYMKNKMDESKPGERPDTVYLAKLPIKWFNDGVIEGPSSILLTKAMEKFGSVRTVDIPMCDPLRIHMNPKVTGFQTKGFRFGQDVFFEAYVQYQDYNGFLTAMESLRNMKWAKRIDGKLFLANVKVDFDRTKHLSEANTRKREEERERLLAEKRRQADEADRAREMEEARKRREEEDRERRREERERKRKRKRELERQQRKEKERRERVEREIEKKNKQKRLIESQRILECVFNRIQLKADRRKREEEEQLKADLRVIGLNEIATNDKEDKLRKVLLKQRELRIRERLKEKLIQSRSRSSSVDSSESGEEQKRSRKWQREKKHSKKSSKSRSGKKKRRSRDSFR